MASLAPISETNNEENRVALETINLLVTTFGFKEARAIEAVEAIGDKSNVEMAYNWLLDHGEEDTGGPVTVKPCPHLDMAHVEVMDPEAMEFGCPCLEGCTGGENWLCLHCGETRCSRYVKGHCLEHWRATVEREEAERTMEQLQRGHVCTGHCLALSLGDLSTWCYQCESYVTHPRLHSLRNRAYFLKFGEQPKGNSGGAGGGAEDAAPSSSSVEEAQQHAQATSSAMHGTLGEGKGWSLPRVAAKSSDAARPGYKAFSATEYLDEDDVLDAKVDELARMIQASQQCIAYTGAGISTASGIKDYATKASGSVVGSKGSASMGSMYDAKPTLAHHALASLVEKGLVKRWFQQNHDGLPQKAGVPQSAMNEVHGSWYDPSNPVVPMSGTLREDLMTDLLDWESKTDLVLALGSSLCGMNADRLVMSAAQRRRTGALKQHGAVIVALQRTQYDEHASLRIFATIDEVFRRLVAKLTSQSVLTAEDQTRVDKGVPVDFSALGYVHTELPYDPLTGLFNQECKTTLDLSVGKHVAACQLHPYWDRQNVAPHGEVVGYDKQGHPMIRYASGVRHFGLWWVVDARVGKLPYIPVVNVNAKRSAGAVAPSPKE